MQNPQNGPRHTRSAPYKAAVIMRIIPQERPQHLSAQVTVPEAHAILPKGSCPSAIHVICSYILPLPCPALSQGSGSHTMLC